MRVNFFPPVKNLVSQSPTRRLASEILQKSKLEYQKPSEMMANMSHHSNSVQFVIKAKENLFLGGTLRKICRVKIDEEYQCQMNKAQSFDSLFRHYAKRKGLRKEDLSFYFTNELLPDHTPESVNMMPQGTNEIYGLCIRILNNFLYFRR